MTPESFIQSKAAEAIKAIYSTEVAETSLQVSVTRKEFEGDYTLVTFPLSGWFPMCRKYRPSTP